MKETILAAIFIIHAAVFAYFYLRRRRQIFDLLFSGGFITLALYYAYNSWQFFAGVQSEPAYLHYFRWAGIILCALATLLFVTYLSRKKRARPMQPTDPPETSS